MDKEECGCPHFTPSLVDSRDCDVAIKTEYSSGTPMPESKGHKGSQPPIPCNIFLHILDKLNKIKLNSNQLNLKDNTQTQTCFYLYKNDVFTPGPSINQ
jgi:hypothetical protein